jgi:hypothetical protein
MAATITASQFRSPRTSKLMGYLLAAIQAHEGDLSGGFGL